MILFIQQWWEKALYALPRVGWKMPVSLFGSIGLIAAITIGLRPAQQDSAHVVGFFNTEGGRVLHPAEFAINKEFAGDYTITITGQIADPIRGDVLVKVTGDQPVDYRVSTRNPPIIPVINKGHAWYTFADNTFYNVSPGDNLIVYVKLRAPVALGEYWVVFEDKGSGQNYLMAPVTFRDPNAAITGGEDCH